MRGETTARPLPQTGAGLPGAAWVPVFTATSGHLRRRSGSLPGLPSSRHRGSQRPPPPRPGGVPPWLADAARASPGGSVLGRRLCRFIEISAIFYNP